MMYVEYIMLFRKQCCITYGYPSNYKNAYIKFNLNAIANPPMWNNIVVSSASLYLYGTTHDALAFGAVGKVTSSWQESSVCWNNKPSTSMDYTLELGPTPVDNVVDVTSIVTDWLENGVPNYGFSLNLGYYDPAFPPFVPYTNYYLNFASSEYNNSAKIPRLVVEYEYVPFSYTGPHWYVATTGNDYSGNGSSSNPFASVHKALSVANSNHTIHVAAGIYTENLTYSYSQDGLKLYGAGEGVTFIEGANSGPVITMYGFDPGFNEPHPFSQATEIKNLTIRNNVNSTGTFAEAKAGGIYLYLAGPTIENVTIQNCKTIYKGGGISILNTWEGSSYEPILRNVTIDNNVAGYASGFINYASGGGIYCNNSVVNLENVEVINNYTEEFPSGGPTFDNVSSGGGISAKNAVINMSRVIIDNNRTPGGYWYSNVNGGGIYSDNSTLNMENVQITRNQAGNDLYNAYYSTSNGGGISTYSGAINMNHVTLANNSAHITAGTYNGDAIQLGFGTELKVDNSILRGAIYCYDSFNVLNVKHTNVYSPDVIVLNGSTYINGAGNISAEPQFVASGNYNLLNTDPGLCMGIINEQTPATDIQGYTRKLPAYSNPDMGAYENGNIALHTEIYSKVYHDDNGVEPYANTTQSFWTQSPDIFIRWNDDNGTSNLGPKYNGNAPNYVGIRVRNIGNVPSQPTTANLYWTRARIWQKWSTEWEAIASNSINVPGVGDFYLGGQIIPADVSKLIVPAIEAGGEKRIYVPWTPTNPAYFTATYGGQGMDNWAGSPLIGMLVRLDSPVEDEITDGPQEQLNVPVTNNVRAINNIALVNRACYLITKVNPGGGNVSIGNTSLSTKSYSVGFTHKPGEHVGSLQDWATLKLMMAPALYEQWVAAGAKGIGIKALPEEHAIEYLTPDAVAENVTVLPGDDYLLVFKSEIKPENNPMRPFTYNYDFVVRETGQANANLIFDLEFTVDKPENLFSQILSNVTTLCAGSCDGGATVKAYGGTEPYSYQWDYAASQQTTATATNLCEGSYGVTITDADGNTSATTVDIVANPALFEFNTEAVLEEDTWWTSENYHVNNLINVPAGVSLTITDSKIEFGTRGQIKVQKGGKLIVDNSSLQHMEGCVNMWNGIMAIADESQPQGADPTASDFNQSFVWIRNHSVISNAGIGVFLGNEHRDTRMGSGGVLWVENSNFVNCYKGVELKSYNYTTLSRFENSVFSCSGEMQNPVYSGQGSRYFVNSWGASGLSFSNVEFVNTGAFAADQRGIAFNSLTPLKEGSFMGCTFKGITAGLSGVFYETKVNDCSFTDLLNGIVVKQYVSQLGNNIFEGNTFDRVRMGVDIRGGNLDIVKDNVFQNITAAPSFDAFGVRMVGSGAFFIENNDFIGSYTIEPKKSGATYGVISDYSGRAGGMIFGNNFLALDYGIQTQNQNPTLAIRCNEFTHIGTYDLSVNGGTLKDQGAGCGSTAPPYRNSAQAGNEWNDCLPGDNIYVKKGTAFYYYAHSESTDHSESTIPECSTPRWQTSFLKVCSEKKTGTSCSSMYPGVPALPPLTPYNSFMALIDAKTQATKQNIEDLKNALPGIIASVDGGNTESLKTEVLSNNLSSGQLKNLLMASLPLSEEVLLALVEMQPNIPNGEIQQIFSSCAPLPQTVLEAIALSSLPTGVKNTIDNHQLDAPLYPRPEYVENQIENLTGDLQMMLNIKLRVQLLNDEKQAAKDELAASELHQAKKSNAEHHVSKGLVQESRVLVNNVVMESLVDPLEDENFAKLMTTIIDLEETGKDIHQMDAAELLKIEEVAQLEKIASIKAKAVLELATEQVFVYEILKIDDEENKAFNSGSTGSFDESSESLNIYPNPCSGDATLDYSLTENGTMVVTDVLGKTVASYQLSAGTNSIKITNDHLDAGIYLYRVVAGNRMVGKGELVILK